VPRNGSREHNEEVDQVNEVHHSGSALEWLDGVER
jgi:hypothetical protein